MKNIALALTLAALFAAPIAASAEMQTQGPGLPAGQYVIVDAQTGRTIGKLVAVAGHEPIMRSIGAVAVSSPRFPRVPTIGISNDEARVAFDERFGIVVSP